MASPITLRLDPDTRRRVTRLARQRRTTSSVILREAIVTFVEKEERAMTPYESIKDLIGSVHGGDPKLSEDTGRKFTELLKARRKQQ